jgi:hypothetical protein
MQDCCSRFGSHGQRFLLAVGLSLPATHGHRKLRGGRGFHEKPPDFKGDEASATAPSRSIKQSGDTDLLLVIDYLLLAI